MYCPALESCKIFIQHCVIHFVQYLERTLTFFCFPPTFLGVIVASALIDISQQKPTDFKDKSQALKNRKALPPAHQGTCV